MRQLLFTIIILLSSFNFSFAQNNLAQLTKLETAKVLIDERDDCESAMPLLEEVLKEHGSEKPLTYLYLAKCYDRLSQQAQDIEKLNKIGSALLYYDSFKKQLPKYKNIEKVNTRIQEIFDSLTQVELKFIIDHPINPDLVCNSINYLFEKIKKQKVVDENIDIDQIREIGRKIELQNKITCIETDLDETELVKRQPHKTDLQLALELYNKKDYENALRLFLKTEEWKDDPVIYKKVAICNLNLKLYEPALYYFTKYLRLLPDASDKKQIEEKIKICESKALSRDDIYLMLAKNAQQDKDPVLAKIYFQKHIENAVKENIRISNEDFNDLIEIIKYLGEVIVKVQVYPNDAQVKIANANLIRADIVSGIHEYNAKPDDKVILVISQKGHNTISETKKVTKKGLDLTYYLSENDYALSWSLFAVSAAAITTAVILGSAAATNSAKDTSKMSADDINSLNAQMQSMSIGFDVLLPIGLAVMGAGFGVRYGADM